MGRFEIVKSKGQRFGGFYWRLVAANGEHLATSGRYLTRWSAKRGAARFAKLAAAAPITVN